MVAPVHNPFPGMNPHLEQPGLWSQVHNRLIVAIADEITPQVASKCRVAIEERIYTSTKQFPSPALLMYRSRNVKKK
ncbi:MAG: DUF4058 family protein [Cyanobacteria bacterium P01_C01_bin.120]